METTNVCLSITWFNKKILIPLYVIVKGSRIGNKDINDDLWLIDNISKELRELEVSKVKNK